MTMVVRQASFACSNVDELVRIYGSECVPRVRAEPGNVDCYILLPQVEGEPVVAVTIWATDGDAARYDATGRGAEIAGKVKHLFAGPPTLRTYRRATP